MGVCLLGRMMAGFTCLISKRAQSFGSSQLGLRFQLHRLLQRAGSSSGLKMGDCIALDSESLTAQKYFANVDACGLLVTTETVHINNAEIITIGTTGIKPRTAVPPGVLERSSVPPIAQTTIDGPGAGAGTKC